MLNSSGRERSEPSESSLEEEEFLCLCVCVCVCVHVCVYVCVCVYVAVMLQAHTKHKEIHYSRTAQLPTWYTS